MELNDLPQDQDSEILVRQHAHGRTVEGTYKRKKERITKETPHTITIQQTVKNKTALYSKINVANKHTNGRQ